MRKLVFAQNQIYHIFNRGIEKRITFLDKREYERALLTLDFYRYKGNHLGLAKTLQLNTKDRKELFDKLKKEEEKIVSLLCFCFMPNHFHFLLKQNEEGGVTKFLSNFTNSYTRYFNAKHKRIGPLFQGTFKAVRMEDDDQMIHVSRYIHLNPVTSYIVKEADLDNYVWSSFPEYLDRREVNICEKELVQSHFASPAKYRKFVYDQVEYAKSLEKIKHLKID